MHPNAKLIETFYNCFKNRDAEGMAACYHADIHFSDPVFLDLHGPMAGAMWRMLNQGSSGLELEVSGIEADDTTGRAHWEARYAFSQTGRQVHNKIDARFEFRDGKIIRHADTFDLWAWAGMALGPVGRLFGWAPPLQNGVRGKARARLDAFVRKNQP